LFFLLVCLHLHIWLCSKAAQRINAADICTFGCAPKPPIESMQQKTQSIELGKLTLGQDTTWQGIVIIAGDIYVPPGVTLTIAPGTQVKFKRIEKTDNLINLDPPYYPYAEIIVHGKLVANGTKDNRIVFTSAEVDAKRGDWGTINLLGSDDNSIQYAKISFAHNGIHAHGSTARITHCEFVENGVGISFKSEVETTGVPWFGKRSNFIITDNLFHRNGGGVGLTNSDGEIMYNEIRDNKFFGVWPKENTGVQISYNEITGNNKGVVLYQTQGMTLTNNNIYANQNYEISIAGVQDYMVDAPYNWFGTTNKQKIEEMIFDKNDDPEIGVILFYPYRDSPVEWKR
jgi:hypothetical protein